MYCSWKTAFKDLFLLKKPFGFLWIQQWDFVDKNMIFTFINTDFLGYGKT